MNLPRISPRAYARITFLALATLTVIIVTGAAVRLTGSGLGCPDWPTCANDRIVAPLEFHAWIEFGNRLFTGACSAAVIAGVLGSLLRSPRRRDLTWLSVSLVVGVLAQAVLGGISVLVDLDPPFVMGHFLLSMIIVWAAYVLHYRAKQPDAAPRPRIARSHVTALRTLGVLTFVVFFAGTVVTGSGPHSGDISATRLPFSPHDVTKVHGATVWLLLLATVATLWRLSRANAPRELLAAGEVFVATLLVQGAIGYFQYAIGVPAGIVILHIIGSIAVWIAVLRLNMKAFDRTPEVALRQAPSSNEPLVTKATESVL